MPTHVINFTSTVPMIKTIHDSNKQQQHRPQPQIFQLVHGAVPTNVIKAMCTMLMIKIIQDF